ncbi:MAG TPA: D-glycerate dehydrogenase [Nitrospiraceae bacterium]|nr:D-glycerate dehydrogenase [Nitrospiraceae bacterium]
MKKARVLVTRELPEPVMQALTERFALINEPSSLPLSREAFASGLSHAEAAICTLMEQIDAETFRHARHLRVIANYAVGFNNIDLEAARTHHVIVTNTPDILTETTADLAWALLLAVARRVPEGHELVQSGQWTGWEPTQLLGTDVFGKTLGIIGMGRIGHAVARRAKGFNMPVLYCRRATTAAEDGSWKSMAFDDVLSEADFISLHVPLTAETRHLIGSAEFRRMRSTAYLINTSRGPVVDEDALVDALRNGRLAGAGLDVYAHEPVLHPGLRELKQVVTLPHVGSATLATRIRMGMVCIENIVAVMEGRPAPNRVA